MKKLQKIALEVQKPILEKYGFAPNKQGVLQMTTALHCSVHSADGLTEDHVLRKKANAVMDMLYGGEQGVRPNYLDTC